MKLIVPLIIALLILNPTLYQVLVYGTFSIVLFSLVPTYLHPGIDYVLAITITVDEANKSVAQIRFIDLVRRMPHGEKDKP